MKHLKLSILPSLRTHEESSMPVMERDGFVDESVVLALVAGPTLTRQLADPGELVLSADDMDFAGWRLSNALPEHATRAVSFPSEASYRRPALPVLDEPGLGDPHHGSHRWWLAGLAGALSTMLFSLLLLTLSSRDNSNTDRLSIIKMPPPNSEKSTMPKTDTSKETPELTEVLTNE